MSLFGTRKKQKLSLTDHKIRREFEDPASPTLKRITQSIRSKSALVKNSTKGELKDHS